MAGRVTVGTHPGLRGESSPGSVLLVAVAQGELVKDVVCQAAFRGPRVAQVADMVLQLLDELDLLVQGAGAQEVAQVGVAALGGQLVQVEQALVDALLQVQGVLHGLEPAAPLLALGLSEVEERDAAPALFLQEHQALGCLAVLVGAEQEEAGEMPQGHVITVEVEGHSQALERGVELQGGVAVDRGLTLGADVLTHLRGWCGHHVGRLQYRGNGGLDDTSVGPASAGARAPAASPAPSHGGRCGRPEVRPGPEGRWLGAGSGREG